MDFNEGIAKDAVAEKKALGLSWFSTLAKAHETISGVLPSHQRSSSIALKPGAKFRSHLQECLCKIEKLSEEIITNSTICTTTANMSLGWKPTFANRINAITKAWQQYECLTITYTLKQGATH